MFCVVTAVEWFQHTAARRRLDWIDDYLIPNIVSTHSRPKAAERPFIAAANRAFVSTHSRPKAAEKSATLRQTQ